MARFFHFHAAEELAQEAARLGTEIPLRDDCGVLASSVRIGSRPVGNRIAIHPMEGCDGTLDGDPDELTFRRFKRFGGGGAKLIWGEATAVVHEGQANPRQLVLTEKNVGLFAKLVEQCRRKHRESVGDDADLLIGLQLTHSGRYSCRRPVIACHCPVLDLRTVVDRATGKTVDPDGPVISDDELSRLEDAYVAAGTLADRAGFDFVDIKQCHRYLLSELLSAKTRPGRFGGSLDNRTRLFRSIAGRLKASHPGLILATRMNAYDGVPFRKRDDRSGEPCPFELPYRTGFGVDESNPLQEDLSEPIEVIGLLRAAGIELVSITMGNPYANPHVVRPAEQPPIDGYEPPEHPLLGVGRHFRITTAIQHAYPDLAIVGSGYSYLQEFMFQAAAANVSEKNVTFAGLGRAALAYPQAPRDLFEHGSLERSSICRTFSYCTNLMRSKHHPLGQFPTGCPPFDKEVYMPIWKEARNAKRDSVG